MAVKDARELKSTDAIATYRALRIGMIGVVALLATSILLEHHKVGGCWQTSISGYYYTPVRAVFVGGMLVVGFALIVIKGRARVEEISLNIAGMLAPVVAVAPTMDVGDCSSSTAFPLPRLPDRSLAPWVANNVHNNVSSLLIVGAFGLGVAVILTLLRNSWTLRALKTGTKVSLLIVALVLLVVWLLLEHWGSFNTRAHGYSADLMFVALIVAVCNKALQHRETANTNEDGAAKRSRYVGVYATVALFMIVGGVSSFGADRLFHVHIGGEHQVAILEAWEILLFAAFWIVQTVDNWGEEVH